MCCHRISLSVVSPVGVTSRSELDTAHLLIAPADEPSRIRGHLGRGEVSNLSLRVEGLGITSAISALYERVESLEDVPCRPGCLLRFSSLKTCKRINQCRHVVFRSCLFVDPGAVFLRRDQGQAMLDVGVRFCYRHGPSLQIRP